jgi:hypothetical protein
MSWLIWPKGCQKCGGDLTPESDFYGAYVKCLQCGTITHEGTKPCFACAVPERRSAHQLVSMPYAHSEGTHSAAPTPLAAVSAGTRREPQNGEGA